MQASLFQQAGAIYRLEELSGGNTVMHRRHPAVKLLGTLLYLVCLMSFDRFSLGRLTPCLLYPVLLMTLGEVPWGMVLKRTAVALPFCLFAGLSNFLLDRNVLYWIGPLPVTDGLLSCGTILLKTLLCVSAVLLLVALTPMGELTGQLRRMHLPGFLVSLFEMTYRYVGALLEEAGNMTTAYRLRAFGKRGLEMGHMGPFLGSLLLKSHDRALRVYQAMQLRGYGGVWSAGVRKPLNRGDWLYLIVTGGGAIFARLVDVPGLLGRVMFCF